MSTIKVQRNVKIWYIPLFCTIEDLEVLFHERFYFVPHVQHITSSASKILELIWRIGKYFSDVSVLHLLYVGNLTLPFWYGFQFTLFRLRVWKDTRIFFLIVYLKKIEQYLIIPTKELTIYFYFINLIKFFITIRIITSVRLLYK